MFSLIFFILKRVVDPAHIAPLKRRRKREGEEKEVGKSEEGRMKFSGLWLRMSTANMLVFGYYPTK